MVIAFLGGIVSYFRWKRHWHNWIFFGILKFCPGSPVHAHFMCRCWNFLTNPSSYFRCYILLWVTHLRLYPEDCPKTVENFTTHCRNGYMTILYFTVWLKDSWFRLEILWGWHWWAINRGTEFEDEFHKRYVCFFPIYGTNRSIFSAYCVVN